MASSLDGKVALVTGATGGIGSQIVRRLAEEGASMIIGYNRSVQRPTS
jgi:3-oxoacyl-[acyl-carrier protein] reductase